MTNSSESHARKDNANGEVAETPPNFWNGCFCQAPEEANLTATMAWMFTAILLVLEGLLLVGGLVLLGESSVPVYYSVEIVYSVFVFINGGNLLRAKEGNAYISAGFTYLIGTSISALLFVYFGSITRDMYEPGIGALLIAVLVLYLLRTVVGIIATPCTLYSGYFWRKGDSPGTKPNATASQAESTTRGNEARFRFSPTYQDFELPATAPITAHLALYAAVGAMVMHVMLLLQPAFVYFPPSISMSFYYTYCYYPTIPVFVVGVMLIRSYRKATYRSAGFIYLYASVCHCIALIIDRDSTKFLAADRSVIPATCLLLLLVITVAAFWSSFYLPSHDVSPCDRDTPARTEAHAVTGISRGSAEPPV